VLLLELSCGHVSAHFDEGVPASDVGDWLWTCIECDAPDQSVVRVVAELGNEELEHMTEDQITALVEAGG
jgi:hypothetical protein